MIFGEESKSTLKNKPRKSEWPSDRTVRLLDAPPWPWIYGFVREKFETVPLINDGDDWETLRKQVLQAAKDHPDEVGGLDAHVPIMAKYKKLFEEKVRDLHGQCIFDQETILFTRHKEEATIARYLVGHGYCNGVLLQLEQYILTNEAAAQPSDSVTAQLSWKGFRAWRATTKRECGTMNPNGTNLARYGNSYLTMALVCFLGSSVGADRRREIVEEMQHKCKLCNFQGGSKGDGDGDGDEIVEKMQHECKFCNFKGGSEGGGGGGGGDGVKPHSESMTPSSCSEDDDDLCLGAAAAARGGGGGKPMAVVKFAPTIDCSTLKRKIESTENRLNDFQRKIELCNINLREYRDQWQAAQLSERKKARDEEIQGMQGEKTVERNGCIVDTNKENRNVVAAYVRDVVVYGDSALTLEEHFSSGKRAEKTFYHDRGTYIDEELAQDGLRPLQKPVISEVRHDYIGVSVEHKVVLVNESKNDHLYPNVRTAHGQLESAKRSLDLFPRDYTRLYHAAYATMPPSGDIENHKKAGHGVYWPDMTPEQKQELFGPLKTLLQREVKPLKSVHTDCVSNSAYKV